MENHCSYLAGRLENERRRLALSQAEAAGFCGVSREIFGKYERGQASPGSEVLAAFARAGADVLYILTGRREKAVPELTDRERLIVAIEAVEEGLALAVRELDLPPARKAELILAAYDLIAEADDDEARTAVIRLVRAA